MQIEAVLFDFDGTLCNTIPLIVDSYQYMYKKFNKPFHTAEEIIAGIGLPLETVIGEEYPEEMPAMLQCYLDYNDSITATHFGIFLGIVPMLQAIQKLEIPMGIVTAKRYDNLTQALDIAELRSYFNCIVTKFDTEQHKPHPAPLIFGMEKLGFSDPTKILYVGDAIFDVKAAKNGGFQSAIVGWTQANIEELKATNPDFWIEKPNDLVELLKSTKTC